MLVVFSLVDHCHCNWLVDTGAGYNILNVKVFQQLNIKPNLSDTNLRLITANGKDLNILGETEIDIVIAGCHFSISVVVADLGSLDGILGMKFLSDGECIIDTFHGTLTVNNFEIMMHKNEVVE